MVSGIHERGAQLPSPKWCINYLDTFSQTFRLQLCLGFLQMYSSMRNLVIPSVEIPATCPNASGNAPSENAPK
jgi:hypothetical protein